MSKNKRNDDFADWQVHFTDPGMHGKTHITIRASGLAVRDGWAHLEDTKGNPLLALPAERVAFVKRLEPGEADGLRVREEPTALETRGGYRGGSPASEVAPPSPVPSGTMAAPPGRAADPGPIETGPVAEKTPPRTRSSRRGK